MQRLCETFHFGTKQTIDDYAKDGWPREVQLICSFYHESLCTWIKTIVNKFAISQHLTLILGVHALKSYLKLLCEYELHHVPNKNVSGAKDHVKNYIKVRPPLVSHPFHNRNRLLNFWSVFTICSLYAHYMFTIFSLYIHYMSTLYSLDVHYMFTIWTLFIHNMFIIYSLYIHYTFTVYSLDVHWMFTIRSLYVHHMFTVHSRYIY